MGRWSKALHSNGGVKPITIPDRASTVVPTPCLTNDMLEIAASIADRITFATHQNDIAAIADLTIHNYGEESIEDLELVLNCQPPLIATKSWRIDRISSNGEVRISDRNVPLAGAMLSELAERVSADIRLTLEKDGNVLSELNHRLTGLARNEWGGAGHMPELLAAFIMPNDPAVGRMLKDAGEVLRRAGEQPAIDGYQSRSRTRVWQIASAIWTAVSSRRLVYAEPPASFEREGQKVRTPSEVLEVGLATCLDTALLFAAALEQAGLNSIIALTKGHALCGVWLQPQQLPALTADDCTDLRKHVALKELALFETTMVVREPPFVFSKAVEEGSRRISESAESEFVYAMDLKRARSQQITPLGSTVETSPTGEPDEQNGPTLGFEAAPALPGFDLGLDDDPPPDTPETRLDHWKRRLLDLTKRNRLLNLKPSKTAIRLLCTHPATLEDKLAAGNKITVIPMVKLSGQAGERDGGLFQNRTGDEFEKRYAEEALDRDEVVSDQTKSDLDAGLVQLYRKARTDLQEGGANTLYLALGILKWKQSEHEERTYRAPLLLVPVKLERRSAASKVKIIHHEDEPVFNMTLLELLRQDFELRIPALEADLPKDQSGVDVPLIWEFVRKAVRDVPGFEVVEDVVLSTFSFAKYLMWKDLADRTTALKESPFVRHLIDHPRDPYEHSSEFMLPDQIDEKVEPAELFMPLPADSSQIVAIHASSQGGDFVLEGPPGTGKSQTIANIIAHNLALGRRVLFVSEKMAALEVVFRRLREKGLGDFCLELHSNKANKREVLDQLGHSWRNRSDRSHAEWQAEAERLKQLRDDLNGLVKALHRPGASGVSPRAAIARTVRWKEIHRLRLDWTGGLEADHARDKEGLEKLTQIARNLGLCFAQLDEDDASTFADVRQADWSYAWQNLFVECSSRLVQAIDRLLAASAAFSAQAGLSEPERTLARIGGLGKIASCVGSAATHNFDFALGPDGSAAVERYETALAALRDYVSQKSKLTCRYPDDRIPDTPIDVWQSQWARACSSWWPMGVFRRRAVVQRMRKSFGLPTRPDPRLDLPILNELQAVRKRMDSAASSLPADAPWQALETDPDTAEHCLQSANMLREGTARLAGEVRELPEIRAAVRRFCVDGRELLLPGMPAAEAANGLMGALKAFEEASGEYLREAQAAADLADDLVALRGRAQGTIDLQQRINAWCRWQAARRDAEASGLEVLARALETGAVEAGEAESQFKTAYCIWLADRLIDDRDELRTFSAVGHDEKIRAFREVDQNVADLSVDYIRAKLSSGIPSPDDLQRPAGYGVLSRELQKRMRHKPVRQLVSEMGPALTALTPCLLMSPLSVSQFLSADSQLFDVVVFDEASQITVWDAIGAMARGRDVIVVGDPKQMPPTSFFDRSASADGIAGEEDGEMEEDLESILDEALAASIKLHRLTGHYRSRHESLIAFSNHRYYAGDLVTYPSAETRTTAVSFVKVDGVYQRGRGRTNPDEAKAIVQDVVRRLNDPVEKQRSIGIVTLNSEQQRLIDDLLDQERRNDPMLEQFFSDDIEEPVFIKNLETVQGDQRDVILLSIGYGPDTPGAKTMSMNFGPLNRKGGERRLNVAITRAASEVCVFASFEPSMIDLTRTSALAVRDLKHYLEFAQRGPAALGEAVLQVGGVDQYDSDFEEAVADGLRHRNWVVHTQIGVSKFRIDLGIVHPDEPGKYLAGIECDGATYHSSPSARDRDRIRHAILENLSWKLIRIWSTDYFLDPGRILDQVHERLSQMLEMDREEKVKLEAEAEQLKSAPDIDVQDETIASFGEHNSSRTEPHRDQPKKKETEPTTVFFAGSNNPETEFFEALTSTVTAQSRERLSADRFYEPGYLNVLRSCGSELIDTHGPITFQHLSEKLARAHGFQRTGSQIKKQVWAAVSKARRSTRTPKGETVFWPDGAQPSLAVPFRGLTVADEERSWHDVPYPEKLGLAFASLDSGRNPDEAAAMAAKIGLARLRQKTRKELEALLETARVMLQKRP